MLSKLILLKVARMGIVGSFGVLLLAEVGALGLPGGWVLVSLLFNIFILGWESHAFLSSIVGGWPPPDKDASQFRIHLFHSAHLFFNRAPTAKDMLKMITRTEELK